MQLVDCKYSRAASSMSRVSSSTTKSHPSNPQSSMSPSLLGFLSWFQPDVRALGTADGQCLGLDDLCVRFIINLPQEELESVERICFQVEEAQWFYEDFVRPLDPDLPSLSLRVFCLRIFQHCPLLSEFSSYHHSAAFSEFLAYKTRVPVRGAVMINQDMSEVVLVKGWKKGASWSFPRGKINKDEPDLDCAIREVYEETGFDIKEAGLVANEEDMKYIDMTMREQHMRLYVFRGVPMDTYFEPRTRKEISKIQWYKLSDLPTVKKKKQQQEGRGEDLATNANKFYMVAPFLNPLNKWIAQQRKLDKLNHRGHTNHAINSAQGMDPLVDDQTFSNGTAEHSAADIGRLVTSLRQSGEAAVMSDLPEVSEPANPAQDASAQLKNLLHANPQSASNDAIQPFPPIAHAPGQAAPNGKDSNALLALLRGKQTTRDQVPQTLLEQVVEHPAVPRSPHHHHRHVATRRVSTLPPAPNFPYPTIQHQRPHSHTQHLIRASGSDLQSMEQPFHSQYPGRLTNSQALPTQQYYQLSGLITSKPSSATVAHLNRQVPAPYQRTGDPEFSHRSQFSNNLPPSIPPASKLPPPKLTTHSSALLDLFKTKQPAKMVPDTQPAQAPTTLLSVVTNIERSREPLEVSPLTEQSNGRDIHITMNLPREVNEQRAKLAIWGNFQATSKREDAEASRRILEMDAERLSEEARTGIRHELQLPTMNETWRQVKVDDQANQRKVVSVKRPAELPQQSRQTVGKDSPSSTSNLSQKPVMAESRHPRDIPQNLQEDVLSRAIAAPKHTIPLLPTAEPKDLGRSNPEHKAALLNLFRSPSTPTAQLSKPTGFLVPPGLPVELSAMPSPGHSRETSETEHPTRCQQSETITKDSFTIQEMPMTKVKTKKSSMSATVNGPLNVPNFDAIAERSKQVRGPVENSGIGHTQRGPPLKILSRHHGTEMHSHTGQRKASVSRGSVNYAPPAALSIEDSRKNIVPNSAPFQPQILRRPARKDSLSPAPSLPSQTHLPPSSKEPPPLDHGASQSQSQKESLLSLFSTTDPLMHATDSSSATPISPLTERLTSQQQGSAVVSPMTSRSRVGSLALSSRYRTVKSGAVQSPRSTGDKKFLLGYLEGVAKERR